VAFQTLPPRHWRSYGDDPLPSGQEALDEPFAAFPSWFMRITCDRCGKDRMLSETHTKQGAMLIRDILKRMRDAAPTAHLWRRPADGTDHAAHRLRPRAGVLQLVPPPGRRRPAGDRGVRSR
jgi:hypothetical protein